MVFRVLMVIGGKNLRSRDQLSVT